MATSPQHAPATRQRVSQSWDLAAARPAHLRRLVGRLSHWTDTAFEVPVLGWRFGWDAVAGLVPGVGDVAGTLVSLYILVLASRCGVPRITMARMGLNVAIDMLVGMLPVVGDAFDVWWKANQRNARLLEQRLAENVERGRRAETDDWLFVGAVVGGLAALLAVTMGTVALLVGALVQAAIGLL